MFKIIHFIRPVKVNEKYVLTKEETRRIKQFLKESNEAWLYTEVYVSTDDGDTAYVAAELHDSDLVPRSTIDYMVLGEHLIKRGNGYKFVVVAETPATMIAYRKVVRLR